jgi:hypothetical protein
MTTEHAVVRSGKSKRKPFNSNVADYSLTIATFAFIGAFTVVHPECDSMPLRFYWRRLFALLETLVDRYPLRSKAGTSFFPSLDFHGSESH